MTIDYLEHLHTESRRFAAVLAGTDPAAPVPSCPDWTAADLLWHLAEVQWFWGTVVAGRLAAPPPDDEHPARRTELEDQFDEYSRRLEDALAATPPETALWTWSTDNTAGFVRRRMAQEALVHRLDAELTAGTVTAMDPELAADGVAEAFEHFFGGWPDWGTFTMDGPIGAVHASDLDRTWLVHLGRVSGTAPSGRALVDEECAQLVESGEAVFTVSAPVRDLEAWVWNRPALEPVVITGDEAAYARSPS